MFLEPQIRILESFLNGHVALKAAESFSITGINYILKYTQTKNSYLKLFHNIIVLLYF